MALDRRLPAHWIGASQRPDGATAIIRPACSSDADAIWAILELVIRVGKTYALPRAGIGERRWLTGAHRTTWCFVAKDESGTVAATYLHTNQLGGEDHVATVVIGS